MFQANNTIMVELRDWHDHDLEFRVVSTIILFQHRGVVHVSVVEVEDLQPRQAFEEHAEVVEIVAR